MDAWLISWMVVDALVRLLVHARILVVDGRPEAVVVGLVGHDLDAAVGKLDLVLACKKNDRVICIRLPMWWKWSRLAIKKP